jgi:hypothetical protein
MNDILAIGSDVSEAHAAVPNAGHVRLIEPRWTPRGIVDRVVYHLAVENDLQGTIADKNH